MGVTRRPPWPGVVKGSCLHTRLVPHCWGYEGPMHPRRGKHFKTIRHHENGNNDYHMKMCTEAINLNHNYSLSFHPSQMGPMRARDTQGIWTSDQRIRFSVSRSHVMFGVCWCWRRIPWRSEIHTSLAILYRFYLPTLYCCFSAVEWSESSSNFPCLECQGLIGLKWSKNVGSPSDLWRAHF